jgi:Spy/CpxP family protein refolding chaperone
MRKTLLAAFISASVFALPAFAQVSLGGAGHAGGGVAVGAGGALNGAMRAPGQLGAQAEPTLHRVDRQTRHAVRHATAQTRSTLNRHDKADLDDSADGSAHADAMGTHVRANAGADAHGSVDAGAAADHAVDTSRGVGRQVRHSAHSAIDEADRTSGSVGEAVRQTATENSVGADAKIRAKANAHGH